MLQGMQQWPHFEQMKKHCAAEGIEIPKNIMAQDPRAHILTPQQYLKNVEEGTMPPMRNNNVLKELAEKSTNPCQDCKAEKCICPAFTPGMPFSSVSSTPINIESDEEQIPQLVENTTLQVLHPPVQLPSDEEADQEVAAICSAPVYYRVRSRNTRRHRYYMYNALDYIEENDRGK